MATLLCNVHTSSGFKQLSQNFVEEKPKTTRLKEAKSSISYTELGKTPEVLFSDIVSPRFYMHFQKASLIYKPHKRNRAIRLVLKQRCQCQVSAADSRALQEEDDSISQVTLIWRAIKLPIYSVALVPLTVGSASAFLQTGIFSAKSYFSLLASSFLIITWINLSNDVYDFDTGADKNKKESVVNLVGSRTGIFIAAYLSLFVGFTWLVMESLRVRNVQSILLLACAIMCGYVYQCPPFRWSYYGLGEPLCFAAFGPFATTAFYFLQCSSSCPENLTVNSTTLCASILVGFTTSLILFCSHFHQVEEDSSVGKISPLVRLGTSRGSSLVKVAVGTLYALLVVFGLTKDLPFPCILLCLLTMPLGLRVVNFVGENHRDKSLIFMAKYFCVRLHTLFGAALAVGLVIARMIGESYIPG